MNKVVNKKSLMAINEVIKRLSNLRRWTNFIAEYKYNELGKHAMDFIVVFLLAVSAEEAGKKVTWENFPKIAIERAFRKAFVTFDIRGSKLEEICTRGKIDPEDIQKYEYQCIAKHAGSEFADFVYVDPQGLEYTIYKAASKIVAYIETLENETKFNGDYCQKNEEVANALKEYEKLPGVKAISDCSSDIFNMLRKISKLRNQNRWAAQSCVEECSVLGHLFDTAVIAYTMSLEENEDDEKLATRMFFMGLFHDVVEAWTKDIPSPVKDGIEGFRKATEVEEEAVINKEIYSKVPEYMSKALKTIMMEDESNVEFKRIMKGADYLSADRECWRQFVAGSRDVYFYYAIEGRKEKIESGAVALPPENKKLHEFFLKYAKTAVEPFLEFETSYR